MKDSINKVAIDAITIIQYLGQDDLAKVLMDRYEAVV